MKSTIMNNMLTKTLNFFIFENQLLLVLKTHLMVTCLKSIFQNSTLTQNIIGIVFSVTEIIEIAIMALFTFFKIRPFRKKSMFWGFDNNK